MIIEDVTQEFYTCKMDAMFKTVFIDEKNPQLLEAVLSCILEGNTHIISWPSTTIPNTLAKEKAKTRDLVVELDGNYINLEVETGHGRETKSKLFTYHTAMWKQNILQGDKYDTKTLFLQIVLQFGKSPKGKIFKEHKMQSYDPITNTVDVWIENFKIIEVNMEKLKKLWYDNSRRDIKKYKYLMMLDMNEEELKKLLEKESDEIVAEYVEKVCNLNKNLNFINTIGKEKEREYEFNTRLDLVREETLEQGIEQGIEQGLERGREQGIEQGRLQTIKTLISNGIDKELIFKTMNLTEDEIESLHLD